MWGRVHGSRAVLLSSLSFQRRYNKTESNTVSHRPSASWPHPKWSRLSPNPRGGCMDSVIYSFYWVSSLQTLDFYFPVYTLCLGDSVVALLKAVFVYWLFLGNITMSMTMSYLTVSYRTSILLLQRYIFKCTDTCVVWRHKKCINIANVDKLSKLCW